MAGDPQAGATLAPGAAFRAQMLELADRLAASGATAAARELRDALDQWWLDQQMDWERSLAGLGDLHHEINNALVGVRGHAQLMLQGQAGREGRVRDRLEVIIREAGRIEKAAQRISEIGRAPVDGSRGR